MESLSWFRPPTKARSWTISEDSSWSRSPTVSRTDVEVGDHVADELVALGQASVVHEPVLRSRPSMLPPSPWKTWTIS
jgi:hypothetical protein